MNQTVVQAARIQMTVANFKRALRVVANAISKEETRYYLNGAYIEFGMLEGVTLTTTDGHRLVSVVLGANERPSYRANAIISRDGIKKALKRLARAKGNCEIIVMGPMNVKIAYCGELIALECIDGTFPDWRRVVPHAYDTTCSISLNPKELRAALLPLIKEATQWQGRNLTAKFSIAKDQWLKISGNLHRPTWREETYTVTRGKRRGEKATRRVKDGEESKPFETVVCPGPIVSSIEIGFNARYLYDLVEYAKGPVTLHMADSASPMRLEASDGATRILMPCRL